MKTKWPSMTSSSPRSLRQIPASNHSYFGYLIIFDDVFMKSRSPRTFYCETRLRTFVVGSVRSSHELEACPWRLVALLNMFQF